MKIYYETNLNEIPKNCLECPCHWCRLPCKKSSYEPTIKDKYTKQRHENCPLKVKE